MRKLGLFLLFIPGLMLAVAPASLLVDAQAPKPAPQGEISTGPADFANMWWTGSAFTNFTVSNFMQVAYLGRHWEDQGFYEGLPPQSSFTNWQNLRGQTGDYPANSGQYHVFACGLWFGVLLPPDSANVCKGAYASDMGGLNVPSLSDVGSLGDISGKGLYFANMLIPEGYDGAGHRLFPVPGTTPASYQGLWPFADTTLNKYRTPGDELDPAAGDMVSHEDTYAVGGDWVPFDAAANMWIHRYVTPEGDTIDAPYDGAVLGVEIEQRTYCWTLDELAYAVVINYKIWNTTGEAYQEPYFSFFMDNDLGSGGSSPGDPGAWDDLVGYDASRGLAYTYDSGGTDPPWDTPPAYVGCLFLETPGDLGITGLSAWTYGDARDTATGSVTDIQKYDLMKITDFETIDSPNDVRMMINSGPYPDIAAGDYLDVTLAVVFGDDLAHLQSNVDALATAFSEGLPWVGVEENPSADPLVVELEVSSITGDEVVVCYSIPGAGNVSVSVFDASGRKVTTLYQGKAGTGTHNLTWNVTTIPAGVYFVRLDAGSEYRTARVVVIK